MKSRGLQVKLMLIMLLLIVSLMMAVCAFLIRGVVSYYLNDFYASMQDVFSIQEFSDELHVSAEESSGYERMDKILSAYSGLLGIDGVNRNYYVLDGETAEVLAGSDNEKSIEITPNIVSALNGSDGYSGERNADYMDVALPIKGSGGSYIIYIIDNKQTVQALNAELFKIIMEALAIGLAISVILSLMLSQMLVTPIQSLTRAANRAAKGDLSQQIELNARDEIGVLTSAFNNMANQLRDTLDEIENERNKLSAVFLHMTDGLVVFSRDGIMIHYNPAAERLLGVRLDNPLLDYTLIFGEIETKENVLSVKSPGVIRAERETNDKSLEIILAPFAGSEETQGGILALIHDVTQQRRSEQTRREFVANVSHELRTPITNVRSYAETLSEAGSDMSPEEIAHFLGVIMNESDRMTKIVQDLLLLSKFDAGQTELNVEKFDLIRSAREIYDGMKLNVEKRGMQMTLDVQDSPVICEGDKQRIEQVIVNVMSNAVRYTPDGGVISVSAGANGDFAVVRVRDTGIGIPKEDIPHLFDRFYRVDKARSRALGGSGLGLSIAREIMNKHSGSISIESEPGKGTSVTISFPLKWQNGGAALE